MIVLLHQDLRFADNPALPKKPNAAPKTGVCQVSLEEVLEEAGVVLGETYPEPLWTTKKRATRR